MTTRALIESMLRSVLGLFFRRTEVAGSDHVPATGPVLFAINHPNGLIDPLVVICLAPRRVSLLGKAPLLRMPLVGWVARALDTIPVYRRQDGADTKHNQETFRRARLLLERGGTIAIAPEGTSHSEPRLKTLKTGAARIALGAGTTEPVAIVPTAIFYTDKTRFRSAALLYFGPPLIVAPVPPDPAGEPPADQVEAVTAELSAALDRLVIQADQREALELAARTERLLTAALPDPSSRTLAEAVTVRQRIVTGYQTLRARAPGALDELVRRLEQIERAMAVAGVDARHVTVRHYGPGAVLLAAGRFVARLLLFLPLALPGLVLHFPAYRVIDGLAHRFTRSHDDVLATAKLIGGVTVFPLTWIAAAFLVGWATSWPFGFLTVILAPLTGYAALRLLERSDRFLSLTRAFGLYLFEPERFATLAAARDQFRRDLLALAGELDI